MKKTFFTLLCLAAVTFMSAQTLQFEKDGHVYENGETIICPFNEDFFEYALLLNIRNLSDQDQNVVVEQDIVEPITDAMVTFCWGLCLIPPTNPYVSPEVLIPANTLSEEDFAVHINIPETETGVMKIVYHAYDANHPDSKISFTLLAGQTANTPEHTLDLGQAYPNPASTTVYFNFKADGLDNVNATVYNLLGQEVKSQLVSGHQNRVSIAVDDLQPGIYFCRFSVNGEVAKTEKFIVKH